MVKSVLSSDAAIQNLWESWRVDDMQLVAPTLLQYEVVNSLYQYQKHGILSAEAIRRALDSSLDLPITLVGDPDLHRRAHLLAGTYRLPAAYEAHYLALAESFGVDLWTTDARLVNALRPFGVDWVKLAGG